MNDSINAWAGDLSQFVLSALREFRTKADDQMERFAVDCHPWNGVIILAFLTAVEAGRSPYLKEAREMAAWKFYDFAAALSCSSLQSDLGSRMRKLYEREKEDMTKAAEQLFLQCAAVIASMPTRKTLSKYNLSREFKISIPHPDTQKEYFPSNTE